VHIDKNNKIKRQGWDNYYEIVYDDDSIEKVNILDLSIKDRNFHHKSWLKVSPQWHSSLEPEREECHTFLNQDASSDEEDRIASHVNTASESSDDEPQIKLPRFEKSGRVIPMSGIVPSMTMPEFTIDRDVRHFITDMDAYLACFQHGIDYS
jgi:hypothetical protein